MTRRPTCHTIVHFEIPANNPETLKTFYSKLFGWKIEKAPGPMEYWMITTAPEGQGVNGGMMKKEMPEQKPLNYIWVESVDEYSKKVQKLGGKVIMPKQEVPEMGWFAIALDPEGNVFGILETKQK